MSIEERFRAIVIRHLSVDADKVTEHASFIDDLGADSLDTVELMIFAEDDFGIEIKDLEWEQAYTFGDACKIITKAVE